MSAQTVNHVGSWTLGPLQFDTEIPGTVPLDHAQDYSNITITLADQRLSNSQHPLELVDGDLASTGRYLQQSVQGDPSAR